MKPLCRQVKPSELSAGQKARQAVALSIRIRSVVAWDVPYEISSYCGGNIGANSVAIVEPSGLTSARYSPLAFRSNRRMQRLPHHFSILSRGEDQKDALRRDGHRRECPLLKIALKSVNDQPAMFTDVASGFWISIQSGWSPSSSVTEFLLLAMNSEMIGSAIATVERAKKAKVASVWRIRGILKARSDTRENLAVTGC
jgi:hypothetical protein